MNLSDKLGELQSAFGWSVSKTGNDEFFVTVWTRPKLGTSPTCAFNTNAHKNLHNAVDEAIILFREHLSDCSLC
jgi:hypothetical protein